MRANYPNLDTNCAVSAKTLFLINRFYELGLIFSHILFRVDVGKRG